MCHLPYFFHLCHSEILHCFHVKNPKQETAVSAVNPAGEFQGIKQHPQRPLYTIVRKTCGLVPVLCIQSLGLAHKLWTGS